MTHSASYLKVAQAIIEQLDTDNLEAMVDDIVALRERGGRLFFVGCGGGAGHAGHAVNDFRKIAGIECYAPTDNVSELTARINDDGWETSYVNWLKGSRLRAQDGLFIFSVGGGDIKNMISPNIVRCLQYADDLGSSIFGIVGRDGGATARLATRCVVVPVINVDMITTQTESFQAVLWHLLVCHPKLKAAEMKWESVI